MHNDESKYAIELALIVNEDRTIERMYDTLIGEHAFLNDIVDVEAEYIEWLKDEDVIKNLEGVPGVFHYFAYGNATAQYSYDPETGNDYDGMFFEPEYTHIHRVGPIAEVIEKEKCPHDRGVYHQTVCARCAEVI